MSYHQKSLFRLFYQSLAAVVLVLVFVGLSGFVLSPTAPKEIIMGTTLASTQQPRADQADISPLQLQVTQTYTIYLPSVMNPATENPATQLISLINAERTQRGCSVLTMNPILQTVALNHSEDMALNDFYGLEGSNGSNPYQRVLDAGYPGQSLGIRITAGNNRTTPEDALLGCTSDKVDTFLLECEEPGQQWEDVGVGYYYLADDTGSVNRHHYWTVYVGQPSQ